MAWPPALCLWEHPSSNFMSAWGRRTVSNVPLSCGSSILLLTLFCFKTWYSFPRVFRRMRFLLFAVADALSAPFLFPSPVSQLIELAPCISLPAKQLSWEQAWHAVCASGYLQDSVMVQSSPQTFYYSLGSWNEAVWSISQDCVPRLRSAGLCTEGLEKWADHWLAPSWEKSCIYLLILQSSCC